MYHKPIAPAFFNSETKAPFEQCADCGKSLLEDDCHYFVEKAVKNYVEYKTQEIIFEYAICEPCMSQAFNVLSEESKQSLMEYLYAQNPPARVVNPEEDDASYLIENCMVKGTSIGQDVEYQIQGEFIGDRMVVGRMPVAVGFQAINEMSEVLSEKTKDDLEDFINKIRPVPPELEDLFPRRTPVLF